jgi:hypothetical protein
LLCPGLRRKLAANMLRCRIGGRLRHADLFRFLFLVAVVVEGSERLVLRGTQAGRIPSVDKAMLGLHALRLRGGMSDPAIPSQLPSMNDAELESAYNRECPELLGMGAYKNLRLRC